VLLLAVCSPFDQRRGQDLQLRSCREDPSRALVWLSFLHVLERADEVTMDIRPIPSGDRYIETRASTLASSDRQAPSFPESSHAAWPCHPPGLPGAPGDMNTGTREVRNFIASAIPRSFGTGSLLEGYWFRVETSRLGLARVVASHQVTKTLCTVGP
jgi:hypothetical protein